MNMIADTKFHLKQRILIFESKFASKDCLQSKTEKVSVTIEFIIFQLH